MTDEKRTMVTSETTETVVERPVHTTVERQDPVGTAVAASTLIQTVVWSIVVLVLLVVLLVALHTYAHLF